MTSDYRTLVGCISLFYQEQQYTIHLDFLESTKEYAVYGVVPLYIKDGIPHGSEEFTLSTPSINIARQYYAFQINYLKQIERYL